GGVGAALALGAQAAVLGTRFLATREAAAHPLYKEKVVAASEEDTVHTLLFGGGWRDAPHRVLRTPFVERWLPEERRGQEQRPDEPVVGETRMGGERVPVARFTPLPPSADARRDMAALAPYEGQSAGLAREGE